MYLQSLLAADLAQIDRVLLWLCLIFYGTETGGKSFYLVKHSWKEKEQKKLRFSLIYKSNSNTVRWLAEPACEVEGWAEIDEVCKRELELTGVLEWFKVRRWMFPIRYMNADLFQFQPI